MEGQQDGEGASLARLAGDLDGSVVAVHEVLDQGQTDAAPLDAARGAVLGAIEPVEDQGQLGRGNAHPGVGDANPSLAPAVGPLVDVDGQGDLSVRGELEGIGQQIQDDLLPGRPIHPHRLGHRRAVQHQGHAAAFQRRLEQRGQLRGEDRQVDRFGVQLVVAGVGEVQQGVDVPQEPQRVAVHHLHLLPRGRGRIGEHALQRPEHQSQRGAQFVADIGEEGGLGPVQRGELLSPLPGRLQRGGVRDRRGDLSGHQPGEGPVLRVERAGGIEADHQESRRKVGRGRHDRREQGPVRRRELSLSQPAKQRVGRTVGLDRPRERRAQRPREALHRRGGDPHPAGRQSVPRLHPRGGSQDSLTRVLRVEQVQQGERHIDRVPGEDLRGPLTGLRRRPGRAGVLAQIGQQPGAPGSHHRGGGLGDGGQHPADLTVLDAYGAVAEGEEALLHGPTALQDHQQVLEICRRSVRHDTCEHRADQIPRLSPHLTGRLSQRGRMLGPQQRHRRVVVQLGQIRPPEHETGKPRHQAQIDG